MSLLDLELEQHHGFPNRNIVGIDEVGRGCIAGPVVAAAVWLPKGAFFSESEKAVCLKPEWSWLSGVRDSKKMTETEREHAFAAAESSGLHWAPGLASVAEIDELNILWASMLAMERAQKALEEKVGVRTLKDACLLVDGNRVPKGLSERGVAIVKGDARSLAIACASVLAKVTRDRMMDHYGTEWVGYGLETHKGYPTPQHLKALDQHGVLEIHRKTFGPVKSRLLAQDVQKRGSHERKNTL